MLGNFPLIKKKKKHCLPSCSSRSTERFEEGSKYWRNLMLVSGDGVTIKGRSCILF